MSATPKKKLCWNCDGSVSQAVDQCTYCGASLKEGSAPQPVKKTNHDLTPPFSLRAANKPESEAPQPPFDVLGKMTDSEDSAESSGNDSASEIQTVVSPLVFMLAGSVFFLFGLVLWLFSDNGVFTLQWTGDYWYVYLAGGTALLGLGWRALSKLDDLYAKS